MHDAGNLSWKKQHEKQKQPPSPEYPSKDGQPEYTYDVPPILANAPIKDWRGVIPPPETAATKHNTLTRHRTRNPVLEELTDASVLRGSL